MSKRKPDLPAEKPVPQYTAAAIDALREVRRIHARVTAMLARLETGQKAEVPKLDRPPSLSIALAELGSLAETVNDQLNTLEQLI